MLEIYEYVMLPVSADSETSLHPFVDDEMMCNV